MSTLVNVKYAILRGLAAVVVFTCMTVPTAVAQDWLGYHTSNYAGVHAVQFNPAFIAGNNYSLDVSLVAGHVNVTNNYLNVDAITLTDYSLFGVSDFKDRFITENRSNAPKSAFTNLNLQAPAVMVRITPSDAIAFAPRVRAFMNADNVDATLAKMIFEELEYPPYWNNQVYGDYLSVNANLWIEYGFSYARILYSDNTSVLKGGITAKLLQGLGAGYYTMRDYSYNFYNADTMGIFRSEVHYGHSVNLNDMNIRYNFEALPSVGFDIGFIYEYCPKNITRNGLYKKKKYIQKTGILAEDETRYSWRIGVSINDLGTMRYRKSSTSRDFYADVDTLPLALFQNINSVASLDQAINTNFVALPSDSVFYMDLPTHLTVFGDVRFEKNFGANATVQVAFNAGRSDDNKNHYITQFTLTPRWEIKWFGAYLPISFNSMGLFNFGFSVRLGPLVVGTGDLLGALTMKRKYSSVDLHFGLRLIIPTKKGKKNAPVCPAYR